jgi:predicted small secreted protein
MRKTAKLLLSLAVLIMTAQLLTACNTTEGAGKDISNAGHDLSNAAERNK